MLEKLYIAREALQVHKSVITTATYKQQAKVDDQRFRLTFYQALSSLIKKHPALCCYFTGQDVAHPTFRRLGSICLTDVLEITSLTSGQTLAQKLQQLHDQPRNMDGKPLWKLVVVKEESPSTDTEVQNKLHTIFVYHHAIGDGLSGVAFQKTLFRELQDIDKPEGLGSGAPPTITTAPDIRLLEPVEKLTPLPLSWSFLLHQVLQEYGPSWLSGSKEDPSWTGAALPPSPADKSTQYISRLRIATIPASDLSLLLTACKPHSVTLISLLTASIVSSLSTALPSAASFRGTTPYTLRRVSKTSMDAMTNQTTAFETSYDSTLLARFRSGTASTDSTTHREALWATASFFQAQLSAELAKNGRDTLAGLLPYVSDSVAFYRKKFGRPRETTFEVSNVGAVQMGIGRVGSMGSSGARKLEALGWEVQSLTFSQGAQPVGAAFSVNVASVPGGPLRLAVSWQEGVIEENIIDEVVRDFEKLSQLVAD